MIHIVHDDEQSLLFKNKNAKSDWKRLSVVNVATCRRKFSTNYLMGIISRIIKAVLLVG